MTEPTVHEHIDMSDLGGFNLYDLMQYDVGDEILVPVSPVRGSGEFRALRVEVKERVTTEGYEENHAIEPWEQDVERLFR